VNLYSFLQKKHSRLFGAVFLSAIFLFSFSPKQAQAQNAYYSEFECLFAPLAGNTCDHSADEASIKTGVKSGVLFNKIPSKLEFNTEYGGTSEPTDTTGIKAITMRIGLTMEPSKEISEEKYFWSRIADDVNNGFFIRIAYKKTIGGSTTYVFKRIKRQLVRSTATSSQVTFYEDSDLKKITTNQTINNVVVKISDSASVPYDTEITADFWYCGGQQSEAPNHDGRYASKIAHPDRIEYFTTDGKYTYKDDSGTDTLVTDNTLYPERMCGGTAAYKIGQEVKYTPTKASVQASQDTAIDPNTQSSKNLSGNDNLPGCAIVFGDGSPAGCAAQVIYYIIYWPIQWVAGIIGRTFDFFLGYSISDESYRASVIVTGWKLIRDISNIFFIIILVWTGLSTVFGFNKVSIKSVVPQLIINALLINFSLFGTRVVIDIANITARVFYNTMSVCDGACRYENGKIVNFNTETTGGYKPLSTKIIASFNPQKIFKPDILSSNTGASQQGSASLQKGINDVNSSDYAGYFIVITLIAALIMFFIAKMFFSVMFMFVGRVIGLYMVMIFAPFAVVTRGGMPLIGNIDNLGWKDWLKDLTNYSMLAPVFVFFLYIIYAFINSPFIESLNLGADAGFMGTVLGIAIPMVLIYMLIQQGVTIAKKYAGKAGEMAQGFATKSLGFVGGAALGVATGGLGLAARRGTSLLNKGVGTWAAANKESNLIANGTNKFLKWGQKSSMDMRNTKLNSGINAGLGALGIKTNDRISGAIGLGQKDYAGGNIKAQKDKEKKFSEKDKAKNDMSHLTDKQAEEVWKKKSEKSAKQNAEKSWEEARLEELKKGDPTMTALKAQGENLAKNLQTAIDNKNTTREAEVRTQQKENNDKQVQTVGLMMKTLTKEKEGNAHQKTDLYATTLESEQGKIKNKYGDIKNAKDLSAAMKREYQARILEDSLLLFKGDKSPGLAGFSGGGTAGTATGIFAALGALGITTGGLSLVGGAIVGDSIDNAQMARLAVAKKEVEAYDKAHSTKNKKFKLTTEIAEIDKLIDSHIEGVLTKAGSAIKLSDLKDSEKEEYFTRARSDASSLTDIAKDDYDAYRNSFKAKKATMNAAEKVKAQKDLEDLSNAYNKAKDNSDRLNKAKDNKNSKQNELEKENQRLSNEEDKNKPKPPAEEKSK
jgi:hypothetical protein